HLRVALAVLILGRNRYVNQRDINYGAFARQQAAVTQVAIDYGQDTSSQCMLLQQATKVEDSVFVVNALQAQPSELAQDSGLVQRFRHRRGAVAEPALHQMHSQKHNQWIGWTTTFNPGVVRLDQSI